MLRMNEVHSVKELHTQVTTTYSLDAITTSDRQRLLASGKRKAQEEEEEEIRHVVNITF